MFVVLDSETSIYESFGRKANPFDPRNYIVSMGLLYQDGRRIKTHIHDGAVLPDEDWLDGVTCIVGINLAFDLTYIWRDPKLVAFFKRGGRIYDCQYAFYLKSGQTAQFPSMNSMAEYYGLPQKPDKIKEYWASGIQTIDIPKQELLDYLDHDLDTTLEIFKRLTKEAMGLGMTNMIREHMEGECATIEMMYNGLYVDLKTAEKNKAEVLAAIADVDKRLEQYAPKLPEEVEFNWNSGTHLSALLFGGEIRYTSREPILDDQGNQTYFLMDGMVRSVDARGQPLFTKAGEAKYRKGRIPDPTKPRMRNTLKSYKLKGIYKPRKEWLTAKEGVYKTDEDVITTLAKEGIEVCKLITERKKHTKDLTTYYEHNGKGMLTYIQEDGLIHHMLNNVQTVTGRLSSSKPNLQNVSRGDTSNAKQMFASRFGEAGCVAGADYSSIEVVIQAWITKDPAMIKDVNDGVDFHCKRLAAKLKEPYEEVFRKAKVDKITEYVVGRTHVKEFSFQRAYGAGVAAIADSTGMSTDDVQSLIDEENILYPCVAKYAAWVEKTVMANAKPSGTFFEVNGEQVEALTGWHSSPTGKRYVFTQEVAPPFLQKRGVKCSFKPTEQKNYSIQGEAGAVMMSSIGMIWRRFVETDNYGGKALITNTVHDSITFDMHKEVAEQVRDEMREIMCSIPQRYKKIYNIDMPVIVRVDFDIGPNLMDLH